MCSAATSFINQKPAGAITTPAGLFAVRQINAFAVNRYRYAVCVHALGKLYFDIDRRFRFKRQICAGKCADFIIRCYLCCVIAQRFSRDIGESCIYAVICKIIRIILEMLLRISAVVSYSTLFISYIHIQQLRSEQLHFWQIRCPKDRLS